MDRIQISKELFGRTIVSFPYDLFLVITIKTIDGRRWHPVEKPLYLGAIRNELGNIPPKGIEK
jgi:hypothetical protein